MTVASTLVPVLSPAGPAAQAIAEVSWVLIIGATLLFVGTMALLAWALFRKRRGARYGPCGGWPAAGWCCRWWC